jgi:hypothetical protein
MSDKEQCRMVMDPEESLRLIRQDAISSGCLSKN